MTSVFFVGIARTAAGCTCFFLMFLFIFVRMLFMHLTRAGTGHAICFVIFVHIFELIQFILLFF